MKFLTKILNSSALGVFICMCVIVVCLPNSTGTKITNKDELLLSPISAENLALNRLKRSRFYTNPIYGAELNEGDSDDVYDRDIEENSENNVKYATTNKVFNSKSGQKKITSTAKYYDELESKTDEEIPDQLAVETTVVNDTIESRACAACTSGTCSPNTVISGLPIIQILGAMFAGIILAAIFIVLYKNFIESDTVSSGGYGYAAAQPQMQYGAPSTQYGTPSSQYGSPSRNGYNNNGYSRSFGSFDFNQLSNFVWKALEKFSDSSSLSTEVVKE